MCELWNGRSIGDKDVSVGHETVGMGDEQIVGRRPPRSPSVQHAADKNASFTHLYRTLILGQSHNMSS